MCHRSCHSSPFVSENQPQNTLAGFCVDIGVQWRACALCTLNSAAMEHNKKILKFKFPSFGGMYAVGYEKKFHDKGIA